MWTRAPGAKALRRSWTARFPKCKAVHTCGPAHQKSSGRSTARPVVERASLEGVSWSAAAPAACAGQRPPRPRWSHWPRPQLLPDVPRPEEECWTAAMECSSSATAATVPCCCECLAHNLSAFAANWRGVNWLSSCTSTRNSLERRWRMRNRKNMFDSCPWDTIVAFPLRAP
jgi:hypothetical protein